MISSTKTTKTAAKAAKEKSAATKAAAKRLPRRDQVKPGDTWDLASLFASDADWEEAFRAWEKRIPQYAKFQGKLAEAKTLLACLKFHLDFDRAAERIGVYAFLKTAEDAANSKYQGLQARYLNAGSRAAQASSYLQPELMAIDDATMNELLATKSLAPYRLMLERWLRYKPHTLSAAEEKLLAMQGEMAQAASQAFKQLHNADMRFGLVKNERRETVELSHASFSTLLHSPKRTVRKEAFHKYYEQYRAHENTLAATLGGSIQRGIYYAKVRGYPSAIENALFHDRVPTSVYDNLIAAVHRHLPDLHRYYEVRRRKMRLDEIHHYDTYVPILTQFDTRRSWKQAVDTVVAALEPLGSDYTAVLSAGLNGRWCDRYENQGKQSGAFSSGSYDADPFILMNYQPDVLDHVFTLAHEAGHSMHTYLAAKHQPYQYYDYTIFVAEVASTFNEQLLGKYLMERAKEDRERAYLVNRQIDEIRGTILRQTMFAEFEKIMHAAAEANEPLTLDRFKTEYHQLLVKYFGPDFVLDPELDLECFRIPHFYRAFYVYKYATGLSAAIALSRRVLGGGKKELDDYLGFLKGGSSKYPLDLLRGAGVDMEQPEPVDTALTHFGKLVDELDELL
jgi:oligoendopeptidase F